VRKVVILTLIVSCLVATAALPASARVVGSDVASWQHPHHSRIAWPAVRAEGHRFVFIKATEGGRYVNPYFHRDSRGSARAGIYRGAYHFARPSWRMHSAVAQAHRFVHIAGRAHGRGELPPTLDLETSGGLRPHRLIAWTHTWLRTVSRLTHRRPMIYSYRYFWSHAMRHTRAFHHYRLWGASYGSPTTFGRAWAHWTFWQFTSHGRVHGIHGRTDVNVFHGPLRRLQHLANIHRHRARHHHRHHRVRHHRHHR
jgi:GH25 family lysozyme M1 (1,4-beta-N-acetylmuramidase)